MYGKYAYEHINRSQLFQNYKIYIGDNENFLYNSECAGGPFLRADTQESYVYDGYADENDTKNAFGQDQGTVWPYGDEQWCNLEGQYLHIVADLSQVNDGISNYQMSLCTLAVYGTKYVRVGAPLPSSVTVYQGQTETIIATNISSFYTIGTKLDINLR